MASNSRRLLQLTVQAFVKHCADEQFSTIDGCYRGAHDHFSIIGVHLSHQRLVRMNILDTDDLEEE